MSTISEIERTCRSYWSYDSEFAWAMYGMACMMPVHSEDAINEAWYASVEFTEHVATLRLQIARLAEKAEYGTADNGYWKNRGALRAHRLVGGWLTEWIDRSANQTGRAENDAAIAAMGRGF